MKYFCGALGKAIEAIAPSFDKDPELEDVIAELDLYREPSIAASWMAGAAIADEIALPQDVLSELMERFDEVPDLVEDLQRIKVQELAV